MAHEIKVPSAGESVSEGTIAQWLKKDGELVTKGENLVVIDTEKASQDLQADASGRLKILVQAGSDVKIGVTIGTIDESAAGKSGVSGSSNATPPAGQDMGVASPTSTGVFKAITSGPQALHVAAPTPLPGTMQPPDQVPAAERKAAQAEGRPMVAPEKGQKVASPDHAAEAKASAQAKTGVAAEPAVSESAPPAVSMQTEGQNVTREPMSRMRRTISAHLLKARNETAMLTTFSEVDMSAIMAMRSKYQDAFVKKHGIKLGFMSFFIKACCEGLQKFPLVNASIDGNDIVYHHYVNIAVAVSTERGLAVPVIRDADQRSFSDLEKALVDLAQKAKTGRIPLEDLKGGTFTITNGGVFGSMMSTPLINPPQVGILGMHSIQERAVVINGKIEVRPMMYLALSYDHRLIDGKEAVQFLVTIRDLIASPERLLLGL
jgi:2-oxoglutarate dehydrogenase E2 component (dihydrolipoamide succinyltransferase)